MNDKQGLRTEKVAAILAEGVEAIEYWSCVLEVMDGLVAKTMEHGWPQPLARQMVAAQYLMNLRGTGPS